MPGRLPSGRADGGRSAPLAQRRFTVVLLRFFGKLALAALAARGRTPVGRGWQAKAPAPPLRTNSLRPWVEKHSASRDFYHGLPGIVSQARCGARFNVLPRVASMRSGARSAIVFY